MSTNDLVTRLRSYADAWLRDKSPLAHDLREAADALEKNHSDLLNAANNCVQQDTILGGLYREMEALKAKLAEAERRKATDPRWLEDAISAVTERAKKAEVEAGALREVVEAARALSAYYGKADRDSRVGVLREALATLEEKP